ncbi:MAG TPA: aspartate aminotransferase family protein, partial [Candidatus Dormibacteraeota bacterium]|nr:aspartate aminotransferase family protein [Candidatus Dormibacteraeota bacterium]
AEAGSGFYAGVPLHWMLDWELPFPLVVAEAHGATLTDVDGHQLADFCLGDTGAMFGHSPEPVARALAAQAGRGLAYMLPTEHAATVGRLLRERFGLPHWQVATTASDANRFALRVARAVTGRPKILVMNGCYHGAVDETYVRLSGGRVVHGAGLIGQFQDLTAATSVVEFNDVEALERALGRGDIACVITEPVLTNCCMVLPDAGYHAALRRATRASGTLLLIDETHTISSGPAGYTGAHALEPDIFVLGKPVAGGVPASVWGFTDAVAAGWDRVRGAAPPGHSGLGTTLSANALAMAAMQATLEEVMTPRAYRHMEALALRLHEGLAGVVARHRLPWHVTRVGARVEFICAPGPLRNGTDASAAHAPELERALHLGLLNRGCAIAPFHNMMLVCPATGAAQVDQLVGAFGEVVGALAG